MLDDLYSLRERARQAAARSDFDEASRLLVAAAQQTHVAEGDYVAVLRPLEDALARKGDARGALTVAWYTAFSDDDGFRRVRSRAAQAPHVDRARTLAAAGDVAEAGAEMERAGLTAAAAIYRENAQDWAGARALWSRLAQGPAGGAEAYQAGLVHLNVSRCAKKCGDDRHARDALVVAVRLIEEAADHFESTGLRERAFDCFQVLVQIGREGGMFEDVLEGFVNAIRILREDQLKYFALHYYEEALSAAREARELSAAATLAREAAEFARAIGMAPLGAHYTLMQAELWRDVARQHLERGAPPEIAENALLSAILAFVEVGQFSRVGLVYRELGALGLEPGRAKHYVRAAKRYEGVSDEPATAAPLPAHLRHDNQFPDVWHVDVLEWEQRGSAAEACADVLLDRRWPDLVRRKAMLARLTALGVEGAAPGSPAVTHAAVQLADQLAQLQLYSALSPLEALFGRPEVEVKIAVLAALKGLFFKRTFVTVRHGLRHESGAVVEQAAVAIEELAFPHAFDPLARVVREAPQARVRAAALRALARVDTQEAAELLLGVLQHAAPVDRAAAAEALKRSRGARFVEAARAALPSLPGEPRALVTDVLRARGLQP